MCHMLKREEIRRDEKANNNAVGNGSSGTAEP
jgi:hypothetical protein